MQLLILIKHIINVKNQIKRNDNPYDLKYFPKFKL